MVRKGRKGQDCIKLAVSDGGFHITATISCLQDIFLRYPGAELLTS